MCVWTIGHAVVLHVRVGAFGFISMFSFVMKFDSDAARLVS